MAVCYNKLFKLLIDLAPQNSASFKVSIEMGKDESVKNFVYGTLNIASQPILCPQNILKVATK